MSDSIKTKNIQYTIYFTALFLLLITALICNICFGSVKVPLSKLSAILFNELPKNSLESTIVWNIRLPRVIGAIISGACLSCAGLLMQIFFRNPIVGPSVLGISSGSSLFVGFIILAGVKFGFKGSSSMLMILAAFVGAVFVMMIVLGISYKVKNVVTLLVIGIMVGYICNAVTNFLVTFSTKEQLQGFHMWSLGSFSSFTWANIKYMLLLSIPFLLVSFLISKPLNAILLGENYARSMGVNIKALRIIIIFTASILTAIPTAFAGTVSFIGLAVPHIIRLSFRTSNNKLLIPGTILFGAVIAGSCDLLAKLLFSPVELPISTITSFIGAPVVIILILENRKGL